MKDVKGYEGLYTITTDGVVYNAKGKEVKQYKGSVSLFDANKKKRNGQVARLLLETYVGTSTGKVVFKDGNKENVCLDNLEWFDPENVTDEQTVDAGSRVSERHANVMKWIHWVFCKGSRGFELSVDVTYRYYVISCMGRNWKHYSLNTYRSIVDTEQDTVRYTYDVCHDMFQNWYQSTDVQAIRYPQLIDGEPVDLAGIYPEFHVPGVARYLAHYSSDLKASNFEYIFRGGNMFKPDKVFPGTEVV